MSISEPFIRRPIGTSLLMLGVLVFGIGAYGLLPVAPLPNVDFPTITVTASYPGASPQTMASAIATPLEQQFTQIPALDQMICRATSTARRLTWLPQSTRRPDYFQRTCRARRPTEKSIRPIFRS
jgi:multidrug efflux pump subunit AcrB